MIVTVHKLKLKQPFFDAVVNGSKTFEVRVNDRNFMQGDIVIMQEVDENAEFTTPERFINADIGFVLSGHGLQEGHVAFSLLNVKEYKSHADMWAGNGVIGLTD